MNKYINGSSREQLGPMYHSREKFNIKHYGITTFHIKLEVAKAAAIDIFCIKTSQS